jgi:DNA repair exonuclease SbcCD ATPase subunit
MYSDYDDYVPENEFLDSVESMIVEEVKKRMKETVQELERLQQSSEKQEIEISKLHRELHVMTKAKEEAYAEAVKTAQRDYWFNCAIGDTVYVINKLYRVKKCEKCGGKNTVPVMVDGVIVNAECPVCGIYEKRRVLEYWDYELVTGKVQKLSIEITDKYKWIYIILNNSENKYRNESDLIFRSKEEAEAKLKELAGT